MGEGVETTIKQALARRQLGTALALFLADDDPISVHCLACGGGELANQLSLDAKETPFAQHALDLHPNMTSHELLSMRNKYWNAMKHSTSRSGQVRDDKDLMAGFDDDQNDHILFIGWYDYANAVGLLPIEAQVFQIWYFANFPEKLSADYPASDYTSFFPGLINLDRAGKKRALRRKIDWARKKHVAMHSIQTERRKLILGRVAAPLPS